DAEGLAGSDISDDAAHEGVNSSIEPAACKGGPGLLRQLLKTNVPVVPLAAVGFEAEAAGLGELLHCHLDVEGDVNPGSGVHP
ncbi:MAG TPA: hypothetical protein VG457_11910, partial [Planctomycetota bacterium]|nr:hypothetical protein [Planctomycetota bacterium]